MTERKRKEMLKISEKELTIGKKESSKKENKEKKNQKGHKEMGNRRREKQLDMMWKEVV